eukprot:Lithocolla_globosa_v1_NODE_3549_length_1640_cov_113.752681.p2 type:complete len:162 gc:universal NODE_3549_length_1640_cov_113.752681:1010-1495(+)
MITSRERAGDGNNMALACKRIRSKTRVAEVSTPNKLGQLDPLRRVCWVVIGMRDVNETIARVGGRKIPFHSDGTSSNKRCNSGGRGGVVTAAHGVRGVGDVCVCHGTLHVENGLILDVGSSATLGVKTRGWDSECTMSGHSTDKGRQDRDRRQHVQIEKLL